MFTSVRYYISRDHWHLVWCPEAEIDPMKPGNNLEAIVSNPFPLDLIYFTYLDAEAVKPIVTKAVEALQEFKDKKDPACLDRAKNELAGLLPFHPYFIVTIQEWRWRTRQAAKEAAQNLETLLPVDKLIALPAQLRSLQLQLMSLFESVFDVDQSEDTIIDRLNQVLSAKNSTGSQAFQFGMLETRYEKTAQGCAEVLYAKNLKDLVDFALRQCISKEVRLRVCKNCGRYFAIGKSAKSEYCTLFPDEKGRTCRDTGAITTWTKKRENDDVFKNYRREYKKRFARIKAGTLRQADFYKWSEQAREQKSLCEAGIITPEEFAAWLAKS